MAFQFTRAYIEYIHDEIVAQRMPGDEPVDPKAYRNQDLIDSAAARPFQSAFGQDAYETIFSKAAALFHSLVCNHAFSNGNKRTALVALDMFLTANGYCLALNNDDSYNLAKRTATHNLEGRKSDGVLREITELLEQNSVQIEELNKEPVKRIPRIQRLYEQTLIEQSSIINHPLNRS